MVSIDRRGLCFILVLDMQHDYQHHIPNKDNNNCTYKRRTGFMIYMLASFSNQHLTVKSGAEDHMVITYPTT